jgi:hypothetical protein
MKPIRPKSPPLSPTISPSSALPFPSTTSSPAFFSSSHGTASPPAKPPSSPSPAANSSALSPSSTANSVPPTTTESPPSSSTFPVLSVFTNPRKSSKVPRRSPLPQSHKVALPLHNPFRRSPHRRPLSNRAHLRRSRARRKSWANAVRVRNRSEPPRIPRPSRPVQVAHPSQCHQICDPHREAVLDRACASPPTPISTPEARSMPHVSERQTCKGGFAEWKRQRLLGGAAPELVPTGSGGAAQDVPAEKPCHSEPLCPLLRAQGVRNLSSGFYPGGARLKRRALQRKEMG